MTGSTGVTCKTNKTNMTNNTTQYKHSNNNTTHFINQSNHLDHMIHVVCSYIHAPLPSDYRHLYENLNQTQVQLNMINTLITWSMFMCVHTRSTAITLLSPWQSETNTLNLWFIYTCVHTHSNTNRQSSPRQCEENMSTSQSTKYSSYLDHMIHVYTGTLHCQQTIYLHHDNL